VEPTDRHAIADAFEALSDDSRYMRFLAHRDTLTPDELRYLTVVDHRDHEALVAVDAGRIVGVSRYVRDAVRPDVGELSVVVAEDWRRHGLARTLLLRLAERARAAGIRRFEGTALPQNHAALELLRGLGASVTLEEGGTARIELPLRPWRLRGRRLLTRRPIRQIRPPARRGLIPFDA
jgi:GNAT superfamily N-acetyltransferase